MTFLDDQLAAMKEALAAGDPEQSAEILVHAALEGPGNFAENIGTLADKAAANANAE